MLILERELFAITMSFKPSPSMSATCRDSTWVSRGKISGPLKPKTFVSASAARRDPELKAATAGSNQAKRNSRLRKLIIKSVAESATWRWTWRVLFANKMHRHVSRMRSGTMFPDINPLPGPQHQTAIVDRNAKIHRRKCGTNMRRHIVLTLGLVNEERVAIGHQTRKKFLKVQPHLRIGILLYQ